MPDWLSPTLVAAVLAALLVGGMVFFAAVVAPLVFAKLPATTAGGFIRAVFPVYYLAMLGLSGLAGLCALAARPVDAGVLLGVAAGFAFARQVLMPRINALRDRQARGESEAGPRFARLHRLSVWINAVQLLAAGIIMVRLILAA